MNREESAKKTCLGNEIYKNSGEKINNNSPLSTFETTTNSNLNELENNNQGDY